MYIDKRIVDENLNKLFDAMATLKDREEYQRFFQDLCTVKEMHDLAQRFHVAGMLIENKKYDEISEKSGASTATISRVKRALLYGADGYKLVLDNPKIKQKKKK